MSAITAEHNSLGVYWEFVGAKIQDVKEYLHLGSREPDTTSQIAHSHFLSIEPYEGPAGLNLPSLTGIVSIPSDMNRTWQHFQRSLAKDDFEGKIDAFVRLVGVPITTLTCLSNAVYYISALAKLDKVLFVFTRLASAFGLVLCAIEGTIESLAIKRQTDFMKTYHYKLQHEVSLAMQELDPTKKQELAANLIEKLKKDPSSIKLILGEKDTYLMIYLLEHFSSQKTGSLREENIQIRCLQSILTKLQIKVLTKDFEKLSEKLHFDIALPDIFISNPNEDELEKIIDQTSLARRVRPFFVKELETQIPDILARLASPSNEIKQKALQDADKLLKNMDTQAKKKLIIHVVGLIAITLSAISLIMFLGGAPLIPALVFMVLSMYVSIVREKIHENALDKTGFNITHADFIPNSMLKIIDFTSAAFSRIHEAVMITG